MRKKETLPFETTWMEDSERIMVSEMSDKDVSGSIAIKRLHLHQWYIGWVGEESCCCAMNPYHHPKWDWRKF